METIIKLVNENVPQENIIKLVNENDPQENIIKETKLKTSEKIRQQKRDYYNRVIKFKRDEIKRMQKEGMTEEDIKKNMPVVPTKIRVYEGTRPGRKQIYTNIEDMRKIKRGGTEKKKMGRPSKYNNVEDFNNAKNKWTINMREAENKKLSMMSNEEKNKYNEDKKIKLNEKRIRLKQEKEEYNKMTPEQQKKFRKDKYTERKTRLDKKKEINNNAVI
jgi:hypothetical protein